MTNIKKRKKHPEPERLWTVAGIAEDWAVSPRTVRRLIADGSLPTVRVRGQVRILASDAIDYLAARRSV